MNANIENKNNRKLKIIILIILTFTIISGITIILINNKEVEEKTSLSENKEKKYKLEVRKTEYGNNNLCLDYRLSSCNKIAFEIPTKNENAKVLSVAYDNYVLYEDEEIYLYNNNNQETLKIDISANAEKYSLEYNLSEKDLYGIKYSQKNKENYYNIKTSKVLYENSYDELRIINKDLISGKIENNETSDYYLLDANEEKIPLLTIKDELCVNFRKEIHENNYYITVESGCNTISSEIAYYTKDYKKITDHLNKNLYTFDSLGNLLVLVDESTINKYNFNGEILFTYKTEGKILSVHNELYLLKKDNALYIKEYNNQEYELMDWQEKYNYYSSLSGYFDEENLINGDQEAGYYFVICYGDNDEYPGIKFYFNPKTKEIKSWEIDKLSNYY